MRKDEAENSLLFEMVMHRYKRRTLLMTNEEPLNKWEKIYTTCTKTVKVLGRLEDHKAVIKIYAERYLWKRARD